MINVSQSFHRTSANAVDDTLTLTKAQMLAVNDNLMPSKYLTICQDDGFIYLYDKSATPNDTTGKFTKFEGGSGVTNYNDLDNRPLIEGVTLTGNKTASDLGLAKTSDLPSVYEGDTAGLVPAAGSDNEGKYLDNDGNWTTVPMPMIGTINRSDIYDTTEKVVGKWTDGRPLYQKTIQTTMPSATTDGTYAVSNVAVGASILHIVKCSGVAYPSNGIEFEVPYINVTSPIKSIRISCQVNAASSNPNNIKIANSDTSYNGCTVYLTICYTKTTDAANSYNYADENDYSTSEKIIGKWIDGKTLYQKTYTKTFDLTSTSAETVIDVASISGVNIVDFIGFVIKDSGLRVPVGSRITDTNYYVVRTNDSNSSIKLQARGPSIANDSGTLYLTVKYTKA